MAELSKKQYSNLWAEYRDNIIAATPVDNTETIKQRRERMDELEANPEQWFKYYFPNYSYAEPAPFHKKATKRVLNNLEWYEVRSWSRELAKDTRTMFELLYLVLTGQKKFVLMVSNSYDNAVQFLEHYKAQLDSNQRITNDYGPQERFGKWTSGDFTTKKGARFLAMGAGQSPRGVKAAEVRPDAIVITDIDTDEDVRNTDIITKRWDWIEKALMGTRSISKKMLVLFLGNIIATDCCVVRAQQYADHVDIINIRDENNLSSWPQKNTEEMIDRVLSKVSFKAQQGEYFNNPITEGEIFDKMHWKHMQPIKFYKFLVGYSDLSYKDSKKNDYKFCVLMGKWKDEYHIHNAYGIQGTTGKFAEGLKLLEDYVADRLPTFWLAEENFMQDTIREKIQTSLKIAKSKIIITPDERVKGHKITRIEAALEPLNRNAKLFFNLAEKDNPHMKLLEGQFLGLSYKNNRAKDDGPDAAEGAKYIIDSKHSTDISNVQAGKRPINKKRY
jgi:phage terminase large subunit-like protein